MYFRYLDENKKTDSFDKHLKWNALIFNCYHEIQEEEMPIHKLITVLIISKLQGSKKMDLVINLTRISN